jgi:glycogen operon protein
MVSYSAKHNERNGENNQDGANDNNSWNCGIEGDTDDPGVLKLRQQLIKNYACYLLFASGIPHDSGRRVYALLEGEQQRLLPGQ